MPDWNAERARLKERFVAGEIGTSTKEELERYLLVLVCSTPPHTLQKQHDLENEAFSQIIKKLLETRIMEKQIQIADEHHAKNYDLNMRAYNLSFSAYWVSVGSAIAAISAAVSTAIQAYYSAPAASVEYKYYASPQAGRNPPPALLEPVPMPNVYAPVPLATNASVVSPPAPSNPVKTRN